MTDRSAPEPDDAVDEAVLDRLRAIAARLEPVPEELSFAARSALAYRDLDVELAHLVDDEDKQLAGVRSGTSAPTLLAFETEDGVIEVELAVEGDRTEVAGQCVPVGATSVTAVQLGREPVDLEVDDLGRFQGSVHRGPVHFVVHWDARRPVKTEWVIA